MTSPVTIVMSKRSLLGPRKSLAIASETPLAQKSGFQELRFAARSSSAGNSLDDALNIPAYRGERSYRDRVSAKASDFYKLNLFDESDITSQFRNRSDAAIVVTALDAQGNPVSLANGTVAKFRIRPNSSKPVNIVEIPSGNYYLQVSSRGEDARYRLNISIERSCGCS